MTDRPVVLLDVDGVLNAWPWDGTLPAECFDDFKKARVRFPDGEYFWTRLNIWHSPKMGARLAALDADIVWLTSWEDRDLANEKIAPLFGWDALPILYREEHVHKGHWWKALAAQAFIEADPRPFIWIDDELFGNDDAPELAWVKEIRVPKILLAPHSPHGITPKQLDMIEEFISKVNEGTWV